MADRKEQYFQARDIYIVEVGIIKAVELPKADTFGKSDGYVKVECLHRQFRTKTIKKTLNPEWNAKTQFQFFTQPKQVKFRVIDWNQPPQKDTPLGDYILPLKPAYFQNGNPGFADLVQMQHCKRGQIEITVKCRKLEPIAALDIIKDCSERIITAKTDMAKCKESISNCYAEHDKEQQAIAAYQEKCDELASQCDYYKKEQNKSENEVKQCDSEIARLEQQCHALEQQYKSLQSSYAQEENQRSETVAQYKQTQEKYQQQYAAKQQQEQQLQQLQEQQEYAKQQQYAAQEEEYGDEEADAEPEEEESTKATLIRRMDAYRVNISKYIGVEDEDEIEEYDENLCRDVLVAYKEKKDIADNYDGDEKEEEEYGDYSEANQYLILVQKWSSGCTEELYRKKDKCLDEFDYSDSNERIFFTDFYVQLNKFFFCAQIVAATLEVFADDIKALTNKKRISAVTFEDLATKKAAEEEEEDDSITVWRAIYEDLDFVIEELGNLFSPFMRSKPLQALCRLMAEFISVCYAGNYPEFSKLLSHYICQIIIEEEISANPMHLLDDACGGTILVLNDKRAFLLKLYTSMADNAVVKQYDEAEEDDEAEEAATSEEVGDKFEQIVALMIVSICQLDCLGGETILDENDKKQIDDKLQNVLAKCGELNVDDKSQKLIKAFFGYFFQPDSGGGCCGDGGGGGFFASLFGSICKGD